MDYAEEGKKKKGLLGSPTVSIVIPVYNGANYLREAIESALNQTYTNTEVLVVNDGSSDHGATERIALSFGNMIRYFSKENGGVASALNAGIRLMTGEYFSWLSHDDVYYPYKIAEQISYLHDVGRQVMLFSNYDVIDSSSKIIRTVSIKQYAQHEIRRALILDYPIHGCSALVPKVFFDKVGYFDECLKTTQDCDMWFRIAKCFDAVHMPMPLIKSREHRDQGTLTMSSLHFRECNEFYIDGMLKVAMEIQEHGSISNRSMFIAECLTSFSTRGFHKASLVALMQYSTSILLEKTIFKFDAMRPILRFLATNICRTKNIIRLMHSWFGKQSKKHGTY